MRSKEKLDNQILKIRDYEKISLCDDGFGGAFRC